MCPLKHFDLCPLKIFWLECAPQNATKFICGAQVSFEARALKIFICKEAGDKVFFTTKKQGKGVEHTNFCAVKNRDYSWTGLKKLFQLTRCRKLFFCRDYALFGGHFLLKFGGEGHKNILRDRAADCWVWLLNLISDNRYYIAVAPLKLCFISLGTFLLHFHFSCVFQLKD